MSYYRSVLASLLQAVSLLHVSLQHRSAAKRFLPLITEPVNVNALHYDSVTAITFGFFGISGIS